MDLVVILAFPPLAFSIYAESLLHLKILTLTGEAEFMAQNSSSRFNVIV